VVHIPAGTYVVGSNARKALASRGRWQNITFRGAGADNTTIRMAGGQSGSHFIFILKGSIGTMRFRGLTLDGNKSAQPNTNPGLCLLSEADGGRVICQDCRFTSANNAATKFSGTANADFAFCTFDNSGYLSNGGHAISPNQTTQATTTVRRCLFVGQGGVDIDTGHMTPGASWQTVIIEECFFRDSKRGVLKISSENARTVMRNSVMRNSGEIPVKMNPTDQNIGTIELEECVIDGATWPAVHLPCPGRLVLNDVAMMNISTEGRGGSAGMYALGQRLSVGRISIHNVDGGSGRALQLGGCSGSISELVYGGVSGVGNGGGTLQSARRGQPLSPSVVSESQCGPRGSDAGRIEPSSAPAASGGGAQGPRWQAGPVDIQFDSTVDAVADLGMDPDGGALIDDALGNVDAGTLVEFPDGEYLVDRAQVRAGNIGLVAKQGATPTLVPAQPTAQTTDWVLNFASGGNHVLSGFEIDATQQGYGGGVVATVSQGDLYVGNLRIRGMMGDGADGLSVAVGEGGTAVVERYVARDGSEFDSASHGLFVHESHAGELFVRDSHVWHWSDNGLYGSSPGYQGDFRGSSDADRGNGAVHVQGGSYKNNNIANIRLGTTGSSVKGAVVQTAPGLNGDAWDSRENPIQPRSGTEPSPVVNSRGIWLSNREGMVVENVDISLGIGPSSGAIVVTGSAGATAIRDTRVQTDVEAPALWVGAGDGAIRVRGSSFTGSSPRPAIRVNGRPDSAIRETCIQMPNSPGVVGVSGDSVSLGGQCAAPATEARRLGTWGSRGQGGGDDSGVAAVLIQTVITSLLVVGVLGLVFLAVVGLLAYLLYKIVT
jgi:hypothetical protein